MPDGNEKEDMNFSIYYLNFSKVYEIKMMIDNVIKSSIQRERSDKDEASKKKGFSLSATAGSKYTSNINSEISSESINKSITSSKLIESLDVIHTQSILLREIIYKCKSFNRLKNCKEGDLLKIDKINLSILDEDNLRAVRLLRKDALKGFSIQEGGMNLELNNLFSSMLQDSSYILKGEIDDEKEDELIIIKIPMEIENEFENNYDISDLLIGHLSLIGVYKKVVTEDFIKDNTLNFFANLENQQENVETQQEQELKKKLFKSNSIQPFTPLELESATSESNTETKYHFIDTIALIQDVEFERPLPQVIENNDADLSLWGKITNFFLNLGGKKDE